MMEAMDRIKKAKVAIMRHPKFCAFSGVMAMGTHTLDDSIPTACTDGLNVRYGPAFVQSLNDKQLNLVVLHETLHVAFRHMRVWKNLWKENPKLANIAADHFVNLALVEADPGGDFLEMPAVGVMPNPDFHGWNVQRIYDYLKREQQDPDDAEQPDGDGGGFDQHDVDAANAHSEAEEQAINDKVQQALRQGEAMARKRSADGTGGLDGAFGELLQSKQDWKALLREFVQSQCQGRDLSTWARPNRRYIGQDIYLPSSYSETMGELVVTFDTSGSCFGGTVMSRFVSELRAVLDAVKPEKVRVLCWDTKVCSDQVFENGELQIADVRIKGGGGTDASCVTDYLAANQIKPQAIVTFTDGECGSNWGTEIAPTLFAVTTSGIRAPYGTTIHIDV